MTYLYNRYKISKEIGKGKGGKIYLAYDEIQKKNVAIKEVDKKSKYEENVLKHIKNKNIDYKNIIECYDIITDHNKYDYFIFEYIKGITLKHFIRLKAFQQFHNCRSYASIMKQLVEGLKLLHSINVVHRDIKCDNIMITSDCQVKIIDFGLSDIEESYKPIRSAKGTPLYMSPEVLCCEKITYKSYLKSDVWSLGTVFYKLLNQKYPYNGNDLYELKDNLIYHKANSNYRKSDSLLYTDKWFNAITNSMLNRNYKLRPNIFQVYENINNFEIYDIKNIRPSLTREEIKIILTLLGYDKQDVKNLDIKKFCQEDLRFIFKGKKILAEYLYDFYLYYYSILMCNYYENPNKIEIIIETYQEVYNSVDVGNSLNRYILEKISSVKPKNSNYILKLLESIYQIDPIINNETSILYKEHYEKYLQELNKNYYRQYIEIQRIIKSLELRISFYRW